LLEVEGLHVQFSTSRGIVRAVEGLSFSIAPGEIVAIVGESGSGKSVSALSIMRLLPRLTSRIPKGRILFEDRNLLDLDDEQMREIRGRDISMIFQEPMTSLNPILTIGLQITEPLTIHMGMDDVQAPAGHDRDRARLQSQAHHRRRAHHRARRHHPGADSGADEGSGAQAQYRADHHYP
jgi:peptide/nickel transport system ATP-binding protein